MGEARKTEPKKQEPKPVARGQNLIIIDDRRRSPKSSMTTGAGRSNGTTTSMTGTARVALARRKVET
jgi:hypothetical protein